VGEDAVLERAIHRPSGVSVSNESNPYAAPRSSDSAPQARGPLEVSFDRTLPDVCLKCGSTSNVGRHVVVLEAPGTRGPILFWMWWGGLLWFLTRKLRENQPGSISFPVPVCAPCDARWKGWQIATSSMWAGVLLSLLVLPALVPAPLPALILFALVPLAAVVTWLARRQTVPVFRGSMDHRVIIDRIPRSALDFIAHERELERARDDARPPERESARRNPRRARRRNVRSVDDVTRDERDAGG
jgi:hypothetical protein